MGAPVESLPIDTIRDYRFRHVLCLNFSGVEREDCDQRRPFGQVTFYTSTALLLASGMVQAKALHLPKFAERLRSEVFVGSRLDTSPTDPVHDPAIRAIPIGLVFEESPVSALREAAKAQAIVTHCSDLSQAGAVAVAAGVAAALTASDIDADFFQGVARVVHPVDADFAQALRELGQRLGSPPEEVWAWVLGFEPFDVGGLSGHALTTVLWAMYAFAQHPSDALKTVAEAIRAGGCVNAPAAIAAALVGARSGTKAFPSSLLPLMQDRGHTLENDIRQLGVSLYRKRETISDARIEPLQQQADVAVPAKGSRVRATATAESLRQRRNVHTRRGRRT